MTYPMIYAHHSLPMSLCARYFSAHFDEECVQVPADDGGSRELSMVWGLGVLADGDWEVFGAWLTQGAGPESWRGVFDEIAVRGVERVSLLLADAVMDVGAVCPGATVLLPFTRIQRRGHLPLASSIGLLRAEARRAVREAASVRRARVALERLLARSGAGRAAVLAPDWPEVLAQFEPFYALRPVRRALVQRGDEALECLGLSLSRAVGRHGPFADVDAAVSFFGRTIARAYGRFSSFVPSGAGLRGFSVSRVAARAGVAAPGH